MWARVSEVPWEIGEDKFMALMGCSLAILGNQMIADGGAQGADDWRGNGARESPRPLRKPESTARCGPAGLGRAKARPHIFGAQPEIAVPQGRTKRLRAQPPVKVVAPF